MTTKNSCRAFIEYHPLIGNLYIPNLDVRILHENGGYFLKTNNMGFRSDYDFLEEKKEGVIRILVFGDSFTAGDGVKNSDRYTDIIGKSFDNIEIYNFGLTSSGTDQQYLIYQEFGSKMKADIVIIAPLVENIRRNLVGAMPNITHDGVRFMRPKPHFELRDSGLVLQNNPVPRVGVFAKTQDVHNSARISVLPDMLQHLNRKYEVKKNVARLLGLKINLYPEYQSSQTYAWKLMRKIMLRWLEEIKVPVIVVPIPWYLHYEESCVYSADTYLERFTELEINNRTKVCDPLRYFSTFTHDQKREFTFLHDKHLTAKGHAALAEAILHDLKKTIKVVKK
jgi:hypothetical protein